MNETKYIFIVHSDIDENNIYAEFETEEEAIAYAKRNADDLTYVDKVEVALDEDGDILEMFDSETIWFWEEEQMVESINLRNKAEQDEFFRLCKECGFVTMGDLENFKVSAGIKDEDLLQALRDYKNSITQNEFDVFQDEAECQNCGEVKRGRRTDGGYYVCDNCVEEDLDSLVEKMEESEDMVECKECFELFPKQDGFKIEVGYVCPHCHASQFAVADEDTFKVDFPEYERVADIDDFVDFHTEETAAPEMPAEPIVEVSAESVEGILKALVKDEEEAIAAYDQAKDAIVANEELPEKDKKEIVDTIEHIKEEEIEHIEELEELDSAEEVETENNPISTEEETEPLNEHVTEEHPAIESEQKLVGTDNAVVDCKVNKVIAHSEDEKPVDCKSEKKPLKKPLTEEVIPELTEKELAQMEAYLKGGKYRSLDTEWTDEGKEGNFYVDECSAFLSYNHNTNKFELGLSTYHSSEDNNAEYPEYHTEEEDYSYDSLAEMYDDGAFTQILDWLYEENIDKITKVLSEETHAQYAKPEGNRIQAYNNALKYAKKNNCDYIYGYTNHAGKFFALEQPLKAKDSDAEEQFRKQYKNCKVVYMVYPDKPFLTESLYNFTPEEMEEYGCDEEGCSVEGWDTYVRCNWCKGVYTEYECVFEADLGWLCPRCQEEIRYHGGPLTIKEYPSEDDIRRTLTEEKENPNEKVEQEDTASVAGMDFEAACKQFGIE